MGVISDGHLTETLSNTRSLLWIGLSLPVIIWAIRSLLQSLFSPLQGIPGPFLARYTRLWKLIKYYQGDFEKTNIALHNEYGPIVRVAPNEYSISEPGDLQTIYGHTSHFIKAPWYYAAGDPDPHKADIFSQRSPEVHAATRRKIASLYSLSNLLSFERYVDSTSEVLLDQFHQFARTREEIDLPHWLQCYAFDVIGEITFAKRFGFVETGGQDINGMMAIFDKYLFYLTHVGIYASLHPYLFRCVQFLQSLGKKTAESGKNFTQQFIDTRVLNPDSEASHRDFLTRLLEVQRDNPEKLSTTDIFMACQINVGAGSDTTGISLSAVFYYLLKNPHAMRLLQEEIDYSGAPGPISFADAQKMPYLQAVIKEALRLHPAVGLGLPRVVPKGGAVLAGRFFPEDCEVAMNAWVIHRDKKIFGSDADQFNPARWLSNDSKTKTDMDKHSLTFGYGSRTCIGKHISLMEMSKIIPYLIRTFEFELEAPDLVWKTINMWFVKQKGFRVRLRERGGNKVAGNSSY